MVTMRCGQVRDMGETFYTLTRDGETVATFPDEISVYVWLHRHHSYSWHHALTHEGYAIMRSSEGVQGE